MRKLAAAADLCNNRQRNDIARGRWNVCQANKTFFHTLVQFIFQARSAASKTAPWIAFRTVVCVDALHGRGGRMYQLGAPTSAPPRTAHAHRGLIVGHVQNSLSHYAPGADERTSCQRQQRRLCCRS